MAIDFQICDFYILSQLKSLFTKSKSATLYQTIQIPMIFYSKPTPCLLSFIILTPTVTYPKKLLIFLYLLIIVIAYCKQILFSFNHLKFNHKIMPENPNLNLNSKQSPKPKKDSKNQENRVKSIKMVESMSILQNSDSKQQQSQHNRKKPTKKKNIWSYKNEKLLIDLYVKYGNKWKELADHFQNLNGTFLKNKFYSRLRKGMRTVNFIIKQFFPHLWQIFDYDIVFKLVNCASNKYDFRSKCPLGKKIQQFEHFPQQIAHRVYMLSFLNKETAKRYMTQQERNEDEIETLIVNINLINERIEPRKSNRKKESKIEKGKIEMKQESIVALHQIKIKAEDYKNKQDGLGCQQAHQLRRWGSKCSREQIGKIQIVGINSNHLIKAQNLLSEEAQHSERSMPGEDVTLKQEAVPQVRCSYRCIVSNPQFQSCSVSVYPLVQYSDLKQSNKSEQLRNPQEKAISLGKMEDNQQTVRMVGWLELYVPFQWQNCEFNGQAISGKQ